MEDDWWLARVLEQQLIEDIQKDCEGYEAGQCKQNKLPELQILVQRLGKLQERP